MKSVFPTLCCTLLLTGCGGGSSSGNDEASDSEGGAGPQILTGTFVDSPVSGLSYETETLSGITNEFGEFVAGSSNPDTFGFV